MPDDNKYVYDVWKMPPGARRRAFLKRYGAPVIGALVACVFLMFVWWGRGDDEPANTIPADNSPNAEDALESKSGTGTAEPRRDDQPHPEPFVQPGEPVTLVRIADAGSVIVRDESGTYRVILAAIDPPTVGEPGYSESVAALKELAPLDASGVTIESDSLVGDKDAYGKPLRYLWVNGVNVNVELVRDAHARYTGQSRYDDRFRR